MAADEGRGMSAIGAQRQPAPVLIGPALRFGVARATPAVGFANMPDRGDLMAYPARRLSHRDGAYTWHRVDLSEAHAIAAIIGGRLQVTMPSGESVGFRYERHVEHPSGDWTWVGEPEDPTVGGETILTFGKDAAFGTIAQQGKEPLRLTMRNGLSWLVETDRKGLDEAATRRRGPDFFIPPKLAEREATSISAPSTGNAAPPMAAAVGAASNTVDLVVGYTAGFAASLGGQSQALTRLNFLVDVTNQAYVNSQVDAHVRLVHALQVDYPDPTPNATALEELTGFRAPSTPITPAPAFSALRAARNQYGGDLVSLVRKFNTPENDGCGIAWLIGGGQSGIKASDEFFGYSVVSDGTDQDENGKSFFCREETLAHEMGHNMGSQHDRDTATVDGKLKYGVYPYSFGYKAAAGAGNFYTVMAYGDSGQTRYRVFSNPRSTYCGGYPCGVAGQADNARSLAQTMPIIATFRATVVPISPAKVRWDFNGDGRADIFWRNTAVAQVSRWYMDGPYRVGGAADSMAAGFRVVGIGDFDGDGRSDVLWTDAGNSYLIMWRPSVNGQFVGNYVDSYPPGWSVAGVGDMNGDGRADILWRNAGVGQVSRWYMDGPSRIGGAADSMSAQYRIVGMGDFDGDNRSDVLWTDVGNTHLVMWRPNANNQFVGNYVDSYPAGWSVAGVGDMNGDGLADIVWRNAAVQQTLRWHMNGPSRIGAIADSMSSSYRIVAISDFDGDGRSDLLWTDSDNTHLLMWRPNANSQYVGNYVDSSPAGWSVVNGTY